MASHKTLELDKWMQRCHSTFHGCVISCGCTACSVQIVMKRVTSATPWRSDAALRRQRRMQLVGVDEKRVQSAGAAGHGSIHFFCVDMTQPVGDRGRRSIGLRHQGRRPRQLLMTFTLTDTDCNTNNNLFSSNFVSYQFTQSWPLVLNTV